MGFPLAPQRTAPPAPPHRPPRLAATLCCPYSAATAASRSPALPARPNAAQLGLHARLHWCVRDGLRHGPSAALDYLQTRSDYNHKPNNLQHKVRVILIADLPSGSSFTCTLISTRCTECSTVPARDFTHGAVRQWQVSGGSRSCMRMFPRYGTLYPHFNLQLSLPSFQYRILPLPVPGRIRYSTGLHCTALYRYTVRYSVNGTTCIIVL
eukprot:COSAG02_NODE_3060_length_7449_cov_6.145578_1_plen_210_part_00